MKLPIAEVYELDDRKDQAEHGSCLRHLCWVKQ
jgi:hypothetical protein